MAAAIFPLFGMVGGALDLSRLYLVKTRLQHACDAGALAGRRAQGAGMWNAAHRGVAEQFFRSNIPNNPYGAHSVTVQFTEQAGRVTGQSSAQVPMTLMKLFGISDNEVKATCDAEMRLPNTDVMFVLDVTGSMASPIPGDTSPKIDGLKTAVKCFYEILARLNTDAACEGGDPTGGTSEETQIRFGFVPYATNVNVGRLLPSNFFLDDHTYQSRRPVTVNGAIVSWDSNSDGSEDFTLRSGGSWSGYSDVSNPAPIVVANSGACNNSSQPVPADQYTSRTPNRAWDADNEMTWGYRAYVDMTQRNFRRTYVSTTRVCKIESRTRSVQRRGWLQFVAANAPGAHTTPAWRYEPIEYDLRPLKSGTGWNAGMTVPFGYNGANINVNWDGCVEERGTVRASTYWPIPPGAHDLDIDAAPSMFNASTYWAPALPNLVFSRNATFSTSSARSVAPITTFTNFNGRVYACPTPARKLQEWADASAFSTYVDSLAPGGNTYHDIGLVWGARLMSPTGLFQSENQFTPQGGEIERHLIFMTDGEACTDVDNYQAYGISWWDRRQTDTGAEPTDGCLTTGSITQQVNARTAALCESVKNKNITLWVIWFGTAQATIEGQMRSCASTDRFFTARNSAELQRTFRSIANQISQLRLTS